jgi:hypothetical protein
MGEAAAEPDTHLERELELPDDRTLYVADNLALADEAGATTWDCGLVLAHYLIKQAELGEVGSTRCVPLTGPLVSRLTPGCPPMCVQASAWWLASV